MREKAESSQPVGGAHQHDAVAGQTFSIEVGAPVGPHNCRRRESRTYRLALCAAATPASTHSEKDSLRCCFRVCGAGVLRARRAEGSGGAYAGPGFRGCGSRQRRAPTGGCAKGIPLNAAPPLSRSAPRSWPLFMEATGAESAAKTGIARKKTTKRMRVPPECRLYYRGNVRAPVVASEGQNRSEWVRFSSAADVPNGECNSFSMNQILAAAGRETASELASVRKSSSFDSVASRVRGKSLARARLNWR